MNKIKILQVFVVLLAAVCGGNGTVFAGAGSAAGQFLKIANGARPAAMGEAWTGAADDVNSIMWNPAGLAGVTVFQQTLSYNAWLEGIGVSYLGMAVPFRETGAFGIGLEYVSMGEIDRVNKNGVGMGTYSASDMLCVLSYGRRMGGKLDAGANVKILQSKIESAGASGVAVDFGAIYHAQPRMQFGGAVKNIGTSLKYGENGMACPLPLDIRLGGGYKLSDTVLATADIDLPAEGTAGLHLGGEYIYARKNDLQIAARFGFKTTTINYLDALAGLSFGFGVQRNDWGIDYALAPYGILGMTHRLNFNLRFVPRAARAAAAPATSDAVPARRQEDARQQPEDLLPEALRWYGEKVDGEKLSLQDQLMLLEKLQEKFEPTGVDLSPLKEMITRLKAGQK